MSMSLLTLTCLLLVQAPASDLKQRERHPLAPSLPLLTAKEYEAIDRVIDRLIAADTGKLKGAQAAQALKDFAALGPEAIPSLIEGLNHAANLQDSCPAVLIAKKLSLLLRGTKDMQLLDYARENIGSGVTAKRHTVVLKDLKVACMLRKSALQTAALKEKGGLGGQKQTQRMSTVELLAAAGADRGPRLQAVLTELEKRSDPKVLPTLALAATSSEEETKKLGQTLLIRHLGRWKSDAVKKRLADENSAVRAAAAKVAGLKSYRMQNQLMDLLTDDDLDVRQAARQALVQLSKGQDFGPARDATAEAVSEARRQWQACWDKQKK